MNMTGAKLVGPEEHRDPAPAGGNGPQGGRLGWLKGLGSTLSFGLPAWMGPLTRARLPGRAILFGRDRFVLVEVSSGSKDGSRSLSHLSRHELSAGSLTPSLSKPNFSAPAETAAAVKNAMAGLPQDNKRNGISVVLPDGCARIALLDLRDIPRSSSQAAQMIRWQIRKRIPFQMDEARQSVQRFLLPSGVERVMVALALDRIVGQYEQVMESLGLQPGLVDLSTLNLANLYLAAAAEFSSPTGDVVLLNLADDDFTIVILRGGIPLFYRSKPLIHGMVRHPEEALLELRRELVTSVSYYRERLEEEGAGIEQVHLRQVAGEGQVIEALVAETWGRPPERAGQVSMPMEVGERGADPSLLEEAAPAIGAAMGR